MLKEVYIVHNSDGNGYFIGVFWSLKDIKRHLKDMDFMKKIPDDISNEKFIEECASYLIDITKTVLHPKKTLA